MNRRKAREQAFELVFQSAFLDESADYIAESMIMSEDTDLNDFAMKLFKGVMENKSEIDGFIERNTKSWKLNRISKTALSILRIAVYEMLSEDEIPAEASINEAVDLAKKYGSKEEYTYVNGVLGGIYKEITKNSID